MEIRKFRCKKSSKPFELEAVTKDTIYEFHKGPNAEFPYILNENRCLSELGFQRFFGDWDKDAISGENKLGETDGK